VRLLSSRCALGDLRAASGERLWAGYRRLDKTYLPALPFFALLFDNVLEVPFLAVPPRAAALPAFFVEAVRPAVRREAEAALFFVVALAAALLFTPLFFAAVFFAPALAPAFVALPLCRERAGLSLTVSRSTSLKKRLTCPSFVLS
jgi:hypothetical protein